MVKLTSNFMIMGQKLDVNYENYCIEREFVLEFRLRTSDFRLRTSDFGLQTLNFRLRTSDFGLQTSDFRLWTLYKIIFIPTIFNANI